MRKIRFSVQGRKAYVISDGDIDMAKKVFSFMPNGAIFAPSYRVWQQTKNTSNPQGWNGRISLLKYRHIGVGALLGMKEEIADKYDVKLVIDSWERQPHLAECIGHTEKDPQYAYQNDCVQAMLDGVENSGGGLVLAATGVGKTKISADFSTHFTNKMLFIVDQVHLLHQSQKEIQAWLNKAGRKEIVGIVGNQEFQPERITVATIQTLHRHRKTAAFRAYTKNMGVIVIDEIHKQMNRSNFDVVSSVQPQAVIGLTATLELKKKEVRLKAMSIAGPVLFEFPITEGAEQGVLSKGFVVEVSVPAGGQFSLFEDDYTKNTVNNKLFNRVACKIAEEALKRKRAVALLVERIAHLHYFRTKLSKYSPHVFYGAITQEKRESGIADFEKGDGSLIIANTVFTKGINIKRLDLCVDAAQRPNRNDAVQKFGRLVRLHKDKDYAIFIGLHTNTKAGLKVASARTTAFRRIQIPILRVEWTDAETLFEQIEQEAARLFGTLDFHPKQKGASSNGSNRTGHRSKVA